MEFENAESEEEEDMRVGDMSYYMVSNANASRYEGTNVSRYGK
jgi:hypothetical protein